MINYPIAHTDMATPRNGKYVWWSISTEASRAQRHAEQKVKARKASDMNWTHLNNNWRGGR